MSLTIRQMQVIDKYAGMALCAALSSFKVLAQCIAGPGEKRKPAEKIALLKFWGMGTIIVASPSIKRLRARYPGAKIIVVTFENNADICTMLGIADRVIGIRIRGGLFAFVTDALRAIRCLRTEKIDILFDMEFFTRFSAIMSYLSGAHERIGFSSWEVWRGNLHTRCVPFNRYWHMVDNFANLLGVDADRATAATGIIIPEDAFASARALLTEAPASRGNRYICVNVNAAIEFGWERRWEGKRFAELTDRIIDAYHVTAVFIGSAGERPYIETVIASARHRKSMINAGGLTTSAKLAALLKESALLISNDSGPLHLAAALDVPTVSLFGSDTPVLYGPRGARNLIFYRNIDCSPCVNVMVSKEIKCCKGHPQCLESITVDEVFESIGRASILKKAGQ